MLPGELQEVIVTLEFDPDCRLQEVIVTLEFDPDCRLQEVIVTLEFDWTVDYRRS